MTAKKVGLTFALAWLCLFAYTVGVCVGRIQQQKVDSQPFYSLIVGKDWVLDYNLTLDDCMKLFNTLTSHGSCNLQMEGKMP